MLVPALVTWRTLGTWSVRQELGWQAHITLREGAGGPAPASPGQAEMGGTVDPMLFPKKPEIQIFM